jgi:hypothetical protein
MRNIFFWEPVLCLFQEFRVGKVGCENFLRKTPFSEGA